MSKNTFNVIDTNEKSDDNQNNLEKAIDVIAQLDELNTAINNYYTAVDSKKEEDIADSQVEIMKVLFDFGDNIPDSCGGWFWNLYKDVFDNSIESFQKLAEKNRINRLVQEAAIYCGTNPDPYNYYAAISENFDEYYAKKIALKEALKESDSKTAIAAFYEEYKKIKDPSLGEIIKDFLNQYKDDDEIVDNVIDSISDKVKGKYLIDTKTKVFKARQTVYDPIILDLNGDGFNIETKELGANFDLDKNGFAEKINWTSKDGFLCLDLNGNGTIDDGGELFGDKTLLADGTAAQNGFEALAQYDGNGDGIIDENDEIFGSLRIWVDADGDGANGEGKLWVSSDLFDTVNKLNLTGSEHIIIYNYISSLQKALIK